MLFFKMLGSAECLQNLGFIKSKETIEFISKLPTYCDREIDNVSYLFFDFKF